METINSPIKNRVLYTKKTSETIVETADVPLESVVEWFLNLEKLTVANIVDGSNDNNSIIPPPPLSNSKNGDPVQLQNYIHELQSSCTAMDGDIAHLELLKKLSFHQMEELKEKLNQSFIKSYELYDEIEEIDQILKKNEKDFGVIVGGTKGLTNVLKGFLVKK